MNKRKILLMRGQPITLMPFSQDFSVNPSLAGWIIPGSAAVASGKVSITPTLLPDVIVNGTFGADTDWDHDATWVINGGVAAATASSTVLNEHVYPLTVDAWYQNVYTVLNRTAGGINAVFGNYLTGYRGGNGTYTHTGQCKTNSQFYFGVATFTGQLDNVSCLPIKLSTMCMVRKFAASQGTIKATTTNPNHYQHAGVVGWLDNPSNPLNLLIATNTKTTASLYKYVNGVGTTLIVDVAITYSAGAYLEIRRLAASNTFQLWYNGSQVSTDKTITDATIIDNKYFGLFSANGASGVGACSFQ
jgi:hypothetical protein